MNISNLTYQADLIKKNIDYETNIFLKVSNTYVISKVFFRFLILKYTKILPLDANIIGFMKNNNVVKVLSHIELNVFDIKPNLYKLNNVIYYAFVNFDFKEKHIREINDGITEMIYSKISSLLAYSGRIDGCTINDLRKIKIKTIKLDDNIIGLIHDV